MEKQRVEGVRRTTAAWVVVVLAAVGTAWGSRDLIQFKVGPIHLLEWAWILWFGFALWAERGSRPFQSRDFGYLWPAVLVFGWGIVQYLLDGLSGDGGFRALAQSRVLQHAILFVYPILWMLVGAWLQERQGQLTKLLALAVFAGTVAPNLLGANVANYSIGPLLAIPFVMVLDRAIWDRSWRWWGAALVLGTFTFIPFWRMWLESMQRSSLILMLWMLATVPMVLAWHRGRARWAAPVTTAVALGMFVLGCVLFSVGRNHGHKLLVYLPEKKTTVEVPVAQLPTVTAVTKIKSDFLKSMQHGDDVPFAAEYPQFGTQPFQGRFRRFCWQITLQDWATAPIFGLGYLNEVPSQIQPGVPNVTGAVFDGMPPLAGPHNSYLTILARMGVVGFLFFSALILAVFVSSWRGLRGRGSLSLARLLTFYIPINGLIYAAVNVGLESPHNSMVLWLFAGVSLALSRRPALAADSLATGPRPGVLLVSYFFPPVPVVASERWGRFSRALAKQGRPVTVWTGPWDAVPGQSSSEFYAGMDVLPLNDPFSSDARSVKESGGLTGASGQASGHGLRAWLRELSFILIDGKWFWSAGVFFRLALAPEELFRGRVVVVTGTPWSAMPAVALACSIRGVRWAADFRDLWASSPFLPRQGRLARRYFAALERWVVNRAWAVFTVSEPIRRALWAQAEGRGSQGSRRFLVFPNGIEGAISWDAASFNSTAGKQAVLLYSGTVAPYHGMGDFIRAWKSAGAAPAVHVLGRDMSGDLAGQPVELRGFVAAEEAAKQMSQAAVLLLTLSPESGDFISGKLMSYLRAGRPILYFGPESSPAAALIREAGLGWVVDCSRPAELQSVLAVIRDRVASGGAFAFQPDIGRLAELSVDRIAARLGECIDAVATEPEPQRAGASRSAPAGLPA